MVKILEKKERRLGEKLFLKGDRCAGPKCGVTRRAYPPGMHGKARRRGMSDFGTYLQEKQKVRFLYGLDDVQVKRYTNEASEARGIFAAELIKLLERRLDNAVYRMGFVKSRRSARQAISHGHILINGKSVRTPSYRVSPGEVVSVKEASRSSSHFADIDIRLKKHVAPKWIALNPVKCEAKVQALPDADDAGLTFDVGKVKEFYSR